MTPGKIDWAGLLDVETEDKAIQELYLLYQMGATSREIAYALKVTAQTIRNLFRSRNLNLKRHGGGNEKHILITLEEYQTYTYKELAERKGISEWLVYQLTRIFPAKPKRHAG